MMDLNTIWYVLIAILLIGYAILDGFDLGVGVLSFFARSSEERRIHYNAIGPVWDGNEVWLITGGAALFAAFPAVYAAVFSGFYLAFFLLLAALIARAVALEFRGKISSPKWWRFWDWCFGLGSLIPAWLFGVALGNLLRGLDLDREGRWMSSFFDLLNPYSILIGVLSLTALSMHGAIYLALKTEGELQARLHRWILNLWSVFVILYVLVSLATAFTSPFLLAHLGGNLLFVALVIVMGLSLVSIPRSLRSKSYGRAFLSSSLTIASQMGMAAMSLYPRILPARSDPGNSLTIYNSASSPTTLSVMLVIALIGMPFVLWYTIFIYRTFRGKVRLEEGGY